MFTRYKMLNDVRKVVFKIKEFVGAQYILTVILLDGVRMCVVIRIDLGTPILSIYVVLD